MKLGERLAALASFVPVGSRIGDIGTDHAYLPIELVEKKIATFAVAGDIHKGPYLAAKENVAGVGLEGQISVRFGNGLGVLVPNEVDTIVIAGMGGSTIVEILSSEPEVTASLKRLILQPMIGSATLRRWLIANGWTIVNETLVQEDGRLYEIIVAEQGVSPALEPIMYDIGLILWNNKHELLTLHLDQLIGQTKRVIVEMATSSSARQSAKYDEYCQRLAQLEAKRRCL